MKSIVSISMEGISTSELSEQYAPNDTFGSVLAAYRHSRGMTQGELAKKSWLTVTTISNYENDARTPDVKTVVALCVALHLSFAQSEYLLRLSGQTFKYDKEDNLLRALMYIAYCSDLTVQDCNEVLIEHKCTALVEKENK